MRLFRAGYVILWHWPATCLLVMFVFFPPQEVDIYTVCNSLTLKVLVMTVDALGHF